MTIICATSYEQLNAVFAEYKALTGQDIISTIKSEMSGDLKDALVAIGEPRSFSIIILHSIKQVFKHIFFYSVCCMYNVHSFFAKLLFKAMKGSGCNKQTLIRIVVTRCEIDLVHIKAAFEAEFKRPLESFLMVIAFTFQPLLTKLNVKYLLTISGGDLW